MEVTFKLTQEQLTRVTAEAVEEFNQEVRHDDMANQAQKFYLEGELLTYRGQRCPLQNGLASDFMTYRVIGMANVAVRDLEWVEEVGAAQRALRVVKYITSEPTMKWWQTQEGIYEEACDLPLEERIALFKKNPSSNWKVFQLLETAGIAIPEIGTAAYRRAVADGSWEEKYLPVLEARALEKEWQI